MAHPDEIGESYVLGLGSSEDFLISSHSIPQLSFIRQESQADCGFLRVL